MALVVVVDDRITNRTIFSRLAGSIETGASVVAFSDPFEVLTWVETNAPDLIITDYKMPGLDGAEFVRRIRALPASADVPVIVITAYEDREFRLRALEAGATDFLQSPVDHQEFVTRGRNILKLGQQQRIIRSKAEALQIELSRSEESLETTIRDSTLRLLQVIDTIPALISASDHEGRQVFENRHSLAVLPRPAPGRPVLQERDRQILQGALPMLRYEEDIQDGEMKVRTLLTSKYPLHDGTGAVRHVLTTSFDISERKQAERALEHLAHHDALTQLPNRLRLYAELNEELAELANPDRTGHPGFALHLIDLDRFKGINDGFGHHHGDTLLKEIGARLLREVGPGDTVARLGGDEFAIMQRSVTSPDGAGQLAQRVIAAVAEPFFIESYRATIGASVGITLAPADACAADQLLKNADLAMYRAKREGRGCARFFAPEMQVVARDTVVLEIELRQGIGKGELVLHYQPQVDLWTQAIVGAESLLRWDRPEQGLLMPGSFLPLAEETGLIVSIDQWVLEEACRQAAAWATAGKPVMVGVNMSAATFKTESVLPFVVETLKQHRPRSPLARARADGGDADGERARHRRRAACIAEARRADRGRRFRHGLFVIGLPAAPTDRPAQDRPVVRAGLRRGGERVRDRPGDRGHRAQPCDGGAGRGRRDAGPARPRPGGWLPLCPGLLPRPPGSGGAVRPRLGPAVRNADRMSTRPGRAREPRRHPGGEDASTLPLARQFWRALTPELRGEYAMSVNRITFGCIMLVSTWLLGNSLPFERWAPWILSWIGLSIGLLASLVLLPAAGVLRRSLAIVVDVAGTTILLTAGGEATAFLYVVYHWIIIGNGFRFGGKYTVAGSIVSIAGFSLVISSDSFWREHSSLSLGLLSGLVVLPAYSFVLIRQLTKARQQAERADQAKSLFLASISHELRTPLNAIIGTAELLSGTRLDRAQAEMVATIDTAADGQLSLIQDVLAFSSIEAGQGQVNVAPFDLVALFGAVRAVIAPAVRKKGLLFNCFISARTPLQLLGDERRLREVLLNICSNAVKFTPTGSITLAADGLDEGDGLVQLRFEVVDTGIGIKPEAQARIFELFTQADETVLDRFGGTGLGLALCERQVALMGGSIGVFSLPERGSTFWITLELSRASTPEPDSPPVRLLPVLNDPEWRRTAESLAALFPAADDAPVVALVEPGNEHLIPPGTDALIEVVALISAHIPPRTVRERYSTMLDRHSPPQEWRRAVRIAGAMRRLSPGSTTRAEACGGAGPGSGRRTRRVARAGGRRQRHQPVDHGRGAETCRDRGRLRHRWRTGVGDPHGERRRCGAARRQHAGDDRYRAGQAVCVLDPGRPEHTVDRPDRGRNRGDPGAVPPGGHGRVPDEAGPHRGAAASARGRGAGPDAARDRARGVQPGPTRGGDGRRGGPGRAGRPGRTGIRRPSGQRLRARGAADPRRGRGGVPDAGRPSVPRRDAFVRQHFVQHGRGPDRSVVLALAAHHRGGVHGDPGRHAGAAPNRLERDLHRVRTRGPPLRGAPARLAARRRGPLTVVTGRPVPRVHEGVTRPNDASWPGEMPWPLGWQRGSGGGLRRLLQGRLAYGGPAGLA